MRRRRPAAVRGAAAGRLAQGLGIALGVQHIVDVLADRRGAPDLYDTWLEIVQAGKAPPFAFIRWIGDDRNGPEAAITP